MSFFEFWSFFSVSFRGHGRFFFLKETKETLILSTFLNFNKKYKQLFATPAEPYVVDKVVARALEKILILHLDHEQVRKRKGELWF